MLIADHLHRLRVDFKVTETLERFVYLYLLVGERVHIIDTGVAGAELAVQSYLAGLGRKVEDIATILLTHSHPDHIGGAAALKEASGCKVLCSAAERTWVEDIEQQFHDRPIPSFHRLTGRSTPLDGILTVGETICLEPNISIQVLDAKGHSHGSQVFVWEQAGIMFTGDAIPAVGDIPIFVSAYDSLQTLERLKSYEGVSMYLPAWDEVYDKKIALEKIDLAEIMIKRILEASKGVLAKHPTAPKEELFPDICRGLELERLVENPLFKRSVLAALAEL